MINKYIIYILIVSFAHFIGCHSFEPVSKSNIQELFESDKNYAVKLLTKDYTEYHFDGYMYSVKNDTLFGTGKKIHLNREEPFLGSIALDDIIEYKIKTSDTGATVGVVLGVAAFALIVLGIITAISLNESAKSCQRR
ncbi:MAG: hypothetical protein WBG58_04855 [Ignavibacteriaceae bacterium]|jgi:hypothetical protein